MAWPPRGYSTSCRLQVWGIVLSERRKPSAVQSPSDSASSENPISGTSTSSRRAPRSLYPLSVTYSKRTSTSRPANGVRSTALGDPGRLAALAGRDAALAAVARADGVAGRVGIVGAGAVQHLPGRAAIGGGQDVEEVEVALGVVPEVEAEGRAADAGQVEAARQGRVEAVGAIAPPEAPAAGGVGADQPHGGRALERSSASAPVPWSSTYCAPNWRPTVGRGLAVRLERQRRSPRGARRRRARSGRRRPPGRPAGSPRSSPGRRPRT